METSLPCDTRIHEEFIPQFRMKIFIPHLHLTQSGRNHSVCARNHSSSSDSTGSSLFPRRNFSRGNLANPQKCPPQLHLPRSKILIITTPNHWYHIIITNSIYFSMLQTFLKHLLPLATGLKDTYSSTQSVH